MVSSVNKAKQFRSISEHDIGKTVKPTPLWEETKDDRDTASDLAVALRVDELPTLELPAVDVDQLPTQGGLRAILMSSSWSSPLTNGILIYDQPTWLLPAIPGSSTVSIQAPPLATR